jgi:hypothetical protein
MKKKPKKTADVVPFVPPADAELGMDHFSDVTPGYDEIVEILAGMDDVEYDRCRVARASAWDVQLATLDRLRAQAKRIRAYRQTQQKPPDPDPNDLKDRLQHILDTEGILDLWIHDWDKVMAGEHRNAKLLYLVATSRLFDKPMHAAIKGPSAAGKSEIRKQVLEFFPREDIIPFDTLSEKALLYFEDDFPNKILSMGEASGLQEKDLQDTLLRQLMSEGKLNYPVAQKIGGQIVTIPVVKHGPVCFMVTTTRATLHAENETRMISLEVDDSEEQTRRVLKKQAQTLGRNIKPDDGVYLDWQDFQRLLRMVRNRAIDVPFADALAALIPPRATRLRRDYPQIIAAIKAHAFIHCYRRNNNEKGETVADLELDYVPVAELIGHIAAEGAGIAVSKEVTETVEAVRLATVNIPTDDGATAFEISKLLHLDKSAARRRLLLAEEKGFVVNLQQRKFQAGKYRLTDQEIEAETLLPSVEEIMAYQEMSSRKGRKSAPPRHRSGFCEEDQEDNGGKDGGVAACGGTTCSNGGMGACHRYPAENEHEKPNGGTVVTAASESTDEDDYPEPGSAG